MRSGELTGVNADDVNADDVNPKETNSKEVNSKEVNLDEEARAIEAAVETLWAGGLVAFPTETVYGLGADATNPEAVARIFEVKGRPRFDPLIVHVPDLSVVETVVAEFPREARRLAERFWPGPLTLVLPKQPHIPDIVTAAEKTVAVRIPRHPVALALLSRVGRPIAAPSANQFGRTSPTTRAHVLEQLSTGVDIVLEGGPAEVGVESTIIAFRDGRPLLLRPGGVPIEDIEPLVGPVEIAQLGTALRASPGRSASHYSPTTPLFLRTHSLSPYFLSPYDLAAGRQRPRIGRLAFTRPTDTENFTVLEVLSETGDLREAAANLFSAMRRLDETLLDYIVADAVPEVGLGRAIMDRLRRAAMRNEAYAIDEDRGPAVPE